MAQAAAAQTFPKLAALLERVRDILAEKPGKARVVIFSERIQTLEFLRDVLVQACDLRWKGRAKDNQIAVFHGTLKDVDQTALVSSFGAANSPIRVLLASDAAAEGITCTITATT